MSQPTHSSVSTTITEGTNSHQVIFHTSTSLEIPLPDEVDGHTASSINQAYLQTLSFEGALMNWLSLSPENVRLFYEDPFKALESSGIEISEAILSDLKNASQLLVKTLNK